MSSSGDQHRRLCGHRNRDCRSEKERLLALSAERAVYGILLCITVASAILVYAFLTDDYRFSYVASNSNRAMSPSYKFAAWWGGQEGSLLLWSWLMAIYSAVAVFTNRRKLREAIPYVAGDPSRDP